MPDPSDTTLTMFPPPANVQPGPLAGATKVTVAPGTGLLLISCTATTSGAANCVLIFALWPEPLTGVIEVTPGVIVAVVVADVKPGADAFESRTNVMKAMQGHIIGKAVYSGLFRRPL